MLFVSMRYYSVISRGMKTEPEIISFPTLLLYH